MCNGSDECKVVVVAKMPVPTAASQGPVTTANYMSPTTPQRLAYDIAAKPGIAAICAGGNTDQVTIDAVEIRGRVAACRGAVVVWWQLQSCPRSLCCHPRAAPAPRSVS